MRAFLLAAALTALPAFAQARPVVVELFTSESCSSCPPADALLGQLAKQPGILALAFHVTYWNGPAWTDQYALTGATDRQSWYAGLQNSQDVYTPEAVIDGGPGIVGSNKTDMTNAIAAARPNTSNAVPISVSGTNMLTIKIGNGSAAGPAQLWLFGYDPQHTTQIGGGENGGATITETNTVRSITSLGGWTGISISLTMPKPAGTHMAVLLQTSAGTILGAGTD
jgi:hypothetical protein